MAWTQALKDVTLEDVPVVGGKNASLGEMLRELTPLGVKVPDGFAVTAAAYRHFCREAGLDRAIDEELRGLDKRNVDDLVRRAERLRDRIAHAPMPADLAGEIETSYRALSRAYGEDATDVAVRSSATAEDLPGASFAGQQESFLNVRGAASVVDAVRRAFASLFTPRAISYRERHGLRPHAGRALGRRSEDGALRSRQRWRDLHARSRHRPSRHRARDVELRTRRERRPGAGRARSVLRPQVDAARRVRARWSGRSSARRRSASSTTRRATSRCGASPSPAKTGRAGRSPTTTCSTLARWALADRGALLERSTAPTRRWTSSGRRTA